MLKKFISIIVIIIVVIAALWGYHAFKETHQKPTAVPKVAPVTVGLSTAKEENWPEQVVTTGEVTSVHGLMVSAEISGRVTKVYVKSGQMVKKGQALFQINPATLLAKLESVDARLKLAKVNYEQQQEIYKKGFGSKILLATAKSRYTATIEEAQQAKAQLNLAEVRAPVAGRVGLRIVKLGDYVDAGSALISLDVKSALRVDFSVPQRYLSQLRLGQTVLVQSEAFPGKVFKAKLYAINARITPEVRSVRLRAMLQTPAKEVLSGLFGAVRLNLTESNPVVVVPKSAVTYNISGSTVFIVNQTTHKAESVVVKTGSYRGGSVALLSGVKAGDWIVISGQNKLRDGALVAVPKRSSL